MTTADETLDALGLLCPLPVLRLRKRLQKMAEGAVLEMQADDLAALIDVPHFCQEAGHRLISATSEGEVHTFLVQKGAAAPK